MSSGLTEATKGMKSGLSMTLGRTVTAAMDRGKEKITSITHQDIDPFDEIENFQMTE